MNNKNSENDLNNVIKQITSSDQFKNIINNISDKLVQLNEQNNISNNETDVNSIISSNEDNETVNNLENCMSSYFLSKNGENICDCIDKLNNNLEKIICIINKNS